MLADNDKTIHICSQYPIHSVSFTKDGKQVLGGGVEGVLRWWQTDDGHEAGKVIQAKDAEVFTTALSPDGKWLVCGLKRSKKGDGKGDVKVWDTQTHQEVLDVCVGGHTDTVFSVDISPDSAKFATGSADKLAFIWSMATGRRLVGPLRHDGVVVAVRFSPAGDRIATATAKNPDAKSIRIYNVDNGQLLLDIPFLVNAHISSSLAWSANGCQLFAVSYSKVQCFDTFSGSLHTTWSVPGGGSSASIALSSNKKFIVVVAHKTVSFWDAVTYKQIGTVIERASSVWSVALSPDDYRVSTGGQDGKLILRGLHDIIPGSYLMVNVMFGFLSLHVLPLMCINNAAYTSWVQGNLTRTEELLTEEILHPFHRGRALAQRALVRARSKQWQMALDDAEKSARVQRSVIGYIALAITLVGNREHGSALRVFDLAFSDGLATENNILLLVKAIILFECGKYDDALSRVNDLIGIVDDQSLYITVRAQMLFLLGGISLNEGDHERAVKLLRRAQDATSVQEGSHIAALSLIFGWDFGGLSLAIQLRLQECIKPFEDDGDAALQSQNPGDAVVRYSTALSLDPSHPADLLVKRSKAQAMLWLWEDALRDANEAIKADPLSPWGYERRHAALYAFQRYDEAIDTFTCMLSLIEESLDQDIRQLGKKYISPSRSEAIIEGAVREVFKRCPIVLIDVESGRLCDGTERMHTFKSESQFKELVSSMTEELDEERILRVVTKYFQYVTLSHVWRSEEPSFQDVNSVWDLGPSPLNEKLKKFCEMVRKDGYRWAWSDTCCIDKTISTVLNQSLKMMYKWYEGSAATFVFLASVASPSTRGDLTRSVWMMRAWTEQELLAPKVIRFYDRDWKPYLGDTCSNHKESSEIMQELADAIGVSREIIIAFNPDDLSVREKLRLASTRNAKVEEDVAYSLIGIFKSDIRPDYGEGYAALGHLLEEIVARSGEVTVLDWTGRSSPYNSCIPSTLAVYNRTPRTLLAIEDAEMVVCVEELRNSLSQTDAVLLYDQIARLPPARFAYRRLHLPCIIFAIERLDIDPWGYQKYHYVAQVPRIGDVKFETLDKLSPSEARNLIFVHPWIRDLRGPLDGVTWSRTSDRDEPYHYHSDPGDSPSPWSRPLPVEPMGDCIRALRLVVRLGQPFHALLLQQQPDGDFKRVATDCEIIVPGLGHHIDFRDIHIGVVEIL